MFIYKITNKTTGKVYIGQTIRTIDQRFHRHISDALSNRLDTHLARAIRKYGEDDFYIEQIDSADNQQELTQKENYWIHYYNSIEEGYNETDSMVACGGNTYAGRTKEEMAITNEKIRQSKLGGKNPAAKKVKCKNVETNQEYFFNSLSEMQKFFNMNNHTFISARLNGRIQCLYKNKWNFAYQDQDYPELTPYKNNNRAKTVIIEDLITHEQQICHTYSAAEDIIKVYDGYISKKMNLLMPEDKQEIIFKNYKISVLK